MRETSGGLDRFFTWLFGDTSEESIEHLRGMNKNVDRVTDLRHEMESLPKGDARRSEIEDRLEDEFEEIGVLYKEHERKYPSVPLRGLIALALGFTFFAYLYSEPASEYYADLIARLQQIWPSAGLWTVAVGTGVGVALAMLAVFLIAWPIAESYKKRQEIDLPKFSVFGPRQWFGWSLTAGYFVACLCVTLPVMLQMLFS